MTSLKQRFEEKFPNGIVVDLYPPESNGHRTVGDISSDILSFISSECERARGEEREALIKWIDNSSLADQWLNSDIRKSLTHTKL